MRRAIPSLLVAILFVLPINTSTAQAGSMRVTVPSPTAASLGKFGDIPVSLYTGVPQISIPLFTAKGRTLELPITLDYHAGGIRVEEIGGWVGIGWSLKAGGTITRTVRGVVDEYLEGYYNTGYHWYNNDNWPDPSEALITNLEMEDVDGEPDQFFYSFAGQSGEIVIGPTSMSQTVKEHYAVPHRKWRIEPLFDPVEGISGWIITTEDGTRYTFDVVERTTDLSVAEPSGSMGSNYGKSYNSTWHLSSIESPGGDFISLAYDSYNVRHRPSMYYEKFDMVSGVGPPCRPDHYGTINEHEIAGVRLAAISTAAHTIVFTAGLREQDALRPISNLPQEPRLDQIEVRTLAGLVLRRFTFEYNHSTGRLTLARLFERDRNNVQMPPYSFSYGGPTLPSTSSYAQDHWGFYNARSNSIPVPQDVTPQGYSLPGADRSPDAAAVEAGVLIRITYPTGGYTEFDYEPNDYGGIGHAAIQPTDLGTNQTRTVRTWDTPEVSFTIVGPDPNEFIPLQVIHDQSPSGCTTQINPPCPYTEIVGQSQGWQTSGVYEIALTPGTYTLRTTDYGGYPEAWATTTINWRNVATVAKKAASGLRIAQITSSDPITNVTTIKKYIYTLQSEPTRSSGLLRGEPTYSYQYIDGACQFFSRTSVSRFPLGAGPVVGYREVTVWRGATGEFGKTRHVFRSLMEQGDPIPYSLLPTLRRTSSEWKRGQEIAATESNSAGQLQQNRATDYAFPEIRRFRGMASQFFVVGSTPSQNLGPFRYNPFEVISAWAHIMSETTTEYDETGTNSVSTSKSYTYGNLTHGQVTETAEVNSNGTVRITRMKYPADYPAGTVGAEAPALTAMQGTAHIHSAVIERWIMERVGTTERVVRAELTTFKEYPGGRYLPYRRMILNSPSALP